MNEGSGGRTSPYFRVSIPDKCPRTIDGTISSDRGLTHIDMSDDAINQITKMIENIKGDNNNGFRENTH